MQTRNTCTLGRWRFGQGRGSFLCQSRMSAKVGTYAPRVGGEKERETETETQRQRETETERASEAEGRKREIRKRTPVTSESLLWKFRIMKTYRSSPMYSNIQSSAGKASWFGFFPWLHTHTHASDLTIYGIHEWVRSKRSKCSKRHSRLPGSVSGSLPKRNLRYHSSCHVPLVRIIFPWKKKKKKKEKNLVRDLFCGLQRWRAIWRYGKAKTCLLFGWKMSHHHKPVSHPYSSYLR